MARKKEQPELTREMILDAARDLFVKQGYEQVSMRQIAKVLGCSHGAIYYHFTNKAELFFALVASHFSLLEHKLEEILNMEVENWKKMKAVMLGFIEFGLTHQSHYEIMFMTKDPEISLHFEKKPLEVYQKFAESLFSLSEGKLSVRDIWSIFLSLHGFVSHYIGLVSSFNDVKDAASNHVDFLLKI